MIAGRLDFVVPIGDEFSKDFARYEDRALKLPFDYTGYNAELIITEGDEGATRLVLKPGEGLTVAGNVVSVEITEAQSKDIENFQRDWYKLRIIDPAGGKVTLLSGWITWQKQ